MIISQINSLEKQELINLIIEQKSQLDTQNIQLQKLQHQIEQLLRNVFGKKSERFIPNIADQIELPLDITPIADTAVKTERITYERKK